MRLEHHVFRARDLIGGNLALDFVNTVTGRGTLPRDWLDDYHALVRWASFTGRFPTKSMAHLSRLAKHRPGQADRALRRSKLLREALYSVAAAVASDRTPGQAQLLVIDGVRRGATGAARLVVKDSRLHFHWSVERSGLALIQHLVTMEAVELLGAMEPDRLRLCDGTNCGWMFIDRSKNGRRRWCDMAMCGNVAKARRFRGRRRP
jgi:predicted RNA-binding Zn ribbon-like protein